MICSFGINPELIEEKLYAGRRQTLNPPKKEGIDSRGETMLVFTDLECGFWRFLDDDLSVERCP